MEWGFGSKSLFGGFNWRFMTDDNPGVFKNTHSKNSIEGKNSFKIKFDGEHNNDFYRLYQIVPVEAENSYTFSAKVKKQDVIKSNNICKESYCYPNWELMSNKEFLNTGFIEDLFSHIVSEVRSYKYTLIQ